jgi:hypothetical protein
MPFRPVITRAAVSRFQPSWVSSVFAAIDTPNTTRVLQVETRIVGNLERRDVQSRERAPSHNEPLVC